jgi:hypothetical protein
MSDRGEGETPARRLTHKQSVEIALNDPAVRRAVAATESPLAIRRRQLYHENARGVLKDLAEAGFPDLQSVGDLRRGHADYAGAVPVLLEWIPKVSYLMLSEDIVRTLSVAFAKRLAAPVFLRLFREPPALQDPLRPETSEPPAEHLRWFIGGGLAVFAGPPLADDLIDLALERRFGEARYQIVEALPKTKDARVVDVLTSLLDDPTIRAAAIGALGKMRYAPARASIEALLSDPHKHVRDQAKKALKRIDS